MRKGSACSGISTCGSGSFLLKNVVFKGSFRGLFCFGFGGGVPPFQPAKIQAGRGKGKRESEKGGKASGTRD